MDFRNILNLIADTDPEVYERTSERRHVIKNLTKGITAVTLPFALGALFNKAYGQTTGGGGANTQLIIDTLNFAILLDYLESDYYATGLNTDDLIPAGADRNAIQRIGARESEHVRFVQDTIRSLGGTPRSKPTFDFTGGRGSGNGPFRDVFSNYDTFLAVAQSFEDTGVRALKGQAPNLMSDNRILEAGLNIHSVEARHAAHLREMRRNRGGTTVTGTIRPWIIGNQSNISNPAAAPVYAGEQNTTQAGVNIANINGQAISTDEASAAFDEPLTRAQVEAIVNNFIAA